MKKAETGFTLIELLVVIAIIGILSSVVLASLNSARQKSRDARRLADLQQIKLAAELHFDSVNEYPQTIAALAPEYIANEPLDPSTGDSYAYEPDAETDATDYCLGAVMEDPSASVASSSNTTCAAALVTAGFTGVNYAVAP